MTLARRINAAHATCLETARSAVDQAVAVGRLLSRAKTRVGHGAWGRWVDDHCGFTRRTAQNYLRLATNAKRVAHFDSVRGALAALAEPRLSQPFDVFGDLVSQEHVKAVLALRDFYGSDLERELKGTVETQEDAALFLVATRPLEHVSFFEPPGDLVEPCRRFLALAAQNGGKVPQWQLAAFWWLCMAVSHGMSAGELAVSVHRWTDALKACALWVIADWHRLTATGAASNIRHAGLPQDAEGLAELFGAERLWKWLGEIAGTGAEKAEAAS